MGFGSLGFRHLPEAPIPAARLPWALSLLERGASSQQSAAQAEMRGRKARRAAEPQESAAAAAPCRGEAAPGRARHRSAGAAGLAQSPKQGHGRNGKNREIQHRDCEGSGGRAGGSKARLGRMRAAAAEERRFGWAAFHVDGGAEQEGTWRCLSVTRPRATDLKCHRPPTQAAKVLSFSTTSLAQASSTAPHHTDAACPHAAFSFRSYICSQLRTGWRCDDESSKD